MRGVGWISLAAALLFGMPAVAASMQDLLRAYPDALTGFDGSELIWRDGTRMPVDDGRPDKSPEELLRQGSILDQLRLTYPIGAPLLPKVIGACVIHRPSRPF